MRRSAAQSTSIARERSGLQTKIFRPIFLRFAHAWYSPDFSVSSSTFTFHSPLPSVRSFPISLLPASVLRTRRTLRFSHGSKVDWTRPWKAGSLALILTLVAYVAVGFLLAVRPGGGGTTTAA